jgi:hypothetical protein
MENRKCLVVGRSIWPTVRQLAITAEPNVIYQIYHSKFRCPMPGRQNPKGPMKCMEVWREGFVVMFKRNDGTTQEARV